VPQLIAVFGISGVGKTTACISLVGRRPNFCHLSASAILSRASGLSQEQLRFAASDQVSANQAVLAKALQEEVSRCRSEFTLLDAQNVIDNGALLIEVPIDVVRLLNPIGIVLLEGNPAQVYERRVYDPRRRPARMPEELAEQMQLIRTVTTDYARTLGIPIVMECVGAKFELDASVDALLNSLG
jgi:adenylate kinase